jgi:hypothetical protein
MPGATDRRSRDQNSMEFLTGKWTNFAEQVKIARFSCPSADLKRIKARGRILSQHSTLEPIWMSYSAILKQQPFRDTANCMAFIDLPVSQT